MTRPLTLIPRSVRHCSFVHYFPTGISIIILLQHTIYIDIYIYYSSCTLHNTYIRNSAAHEYFRFSRFFIFVVTTRARRDRQPLISGPVRLYSISYKQASYVHTYVMHHQVLVITNRSNQSINQVNPSSEHAATNSKHFLLRTTHLSSYNISLRRLAALVPALGTLGMKLCLLYAVELSQVQ